jgi:heme/copper-type cytochrome/quinol oxidase subunit 2
MRLPLLARSLGAILGLLLAWPRTVAACATCFGQSDSPLAEGMNWGIFALLAVIVTVLAGVASFFVFLARRAGSPTERARGLHTGSETPSSLSL